MRIVYPSLKRSALLLSLLISSWLRRYVGRRIAHSLLLPALYICLISHFSQVAASAQMGVPKGRSPLYNSRPYSPSAPSGLPKALNDVGIDQKLNEQLPLDLEFRDENDRVVKLGDYFSRKPVVLSLVF